VKYSTYNNKVYILGDINEIEMIKGFIKRLESCKKIISIIKPQFGISFKSCTNLKDMLSNKEKISEITDLNNPNLLDFILNGLSFSANCTVDKKIKSSLQGLITMLLEGQEQFKDVAFAGLEILRTIEENPLFDMPEDKEIVTLAKVISDILIPENETNVTKTMRISNPKQRMIEALGKGLQNKHIMDVYDLIDGAGPAFCEIQNEYFAKFPFVVEFIEDLEEFARANIEFGLANETISLNASLRTEGALELWQFFKSRLEYDS
jgi:hypothetical protein